MEWLNLLFAGTPLWMWLMFMGIVTALLVFDLGVLNKDDHEIGVKESLKLSALHCHGPGVWRLGMVVPRR
jgi:tellurite resistance protein TerC